MVICEKKEIKKCLLKITDFYISQSHSPQGEKMKKVQHNANPERAREPSKTGALSNAVIHESEKVNQASHACFVTLRISFKPQKQNSLVRHDLSFPSTAPERGRR